MKKITIITFLVFLIFLPSKGICGEKITFEDITDPTLRHGTSVSVGTVETGYVEIHLDAPYATAFINEDLWAEAGYEQSARVLGPSIRVDMERFFNAYLKVPDSAEATTHGYSHGLYRFSVTSKCKNTATVKAVFVAESIGELMLSDPRPGVSFRLYDYEPVIGTTPPGDALCSYYSGDDGSGPVSCVIPLEVDKEYFLQAFLSHLPPTPDSITNTDNDVTKKSGTANLKITIRDKCWPK